jgi:hypothetical protein
MYTNISIGRPLCPYCDIPWGHWGGLHHEIYSHEYGPVGQHGYWHGIPDRSDGEIYDDDILSPLPDASS